MIELEFQILSDRREGLLVDLGRLVVASGYTLLRQRLSQDQRGTWLTMRVRGPAEHQSSLEEGLATHARVRSFETALAGVGHAPTPPLVTPAPVATPAPVPAPAAGSPDLPADVRQVEAVLPQLARDYPKVYPWLLTLEHAVADPARKPSLLLAGQRTGTWIYKRDYAMGAKLPLVDAIKRIALPALRELVAAECRDGQFHIQNSPLCPPGGHTGCHFFAGYLEGVLNGAMGRHDVEVHRLHCRSDGAPACVIDVSD
ncbi:MULTISPECIES: 4-vinyl reductase [Dyella]|nr:MULTISPECIES: 4-vinyl reductase [Dyella]